MAASRPPATRRSVVLCTIPSDSHSWNLVFMEMLLSELGCDVVNLGPCTPEELLATSCRRHEPDLVVVSSVNGHARSEGESLIRHLRAHPGLRGLPIVLGGKLGTDGELAPSDTQRLLDAGFTALFQDNASMDRFTDFLERSHARLAL